ncbi:hypothetical protein MJO28_004021 [Puccinia striiformis f. sp. tritici]|uniref:Uncharacterized protein n=2 Tax=Puccinia striiformis TaxID=27350 RepID=A0A2S4ULG0_9BASI|nr:hypothetical protein MJO28_004021 [Puccinia striiformis f. sp. tritici]POV98145.1 hypothetical protein PSTT_14608 [Puccinia striiformis]
MGKPLSPSKFSEKVASIKLSMTEVNTSIYRIKTWTEYSHTVIFKELYQEVTNKIVKLEEELADLEASVMSSTIEDNNQDIQAPQNSPPKAGNLDFEAEVKIERKSGIIRADWKAFQMPDSREDLPRNLDLGIEPTKILQAARLSTQELYNVPPLDNKYMDNYWLDERPSELFRKVFSEEWDLDRIKENHQLLLDLPGGSTSNLNFIHILTDIGSEAFLKEGDWTSIYGKIGYKLRVSIYNEDKKGLRWARNNVPDYIPITKLGETVLDSVQKRHQQQC